VVHSAHIFVAIQAHKGLTAFALGCSLVESAAPPLQFWSLVRDLLLSADAALLTSAAQDLVCCGVPCRLSAYLAGCLHAVAAVGTPQLTALIQPVSHRVVPASRVRGAAQ
jgi:hypothetical protein